MLSLLLCDPSVVRPKFSGGVLSVLTWAHEAHMLLRPASAGVVGKYPVKAEKAVLFSDLLVLAFMK